MSRPWHVMLSAGQRRPRYVEVTAEGVIRWTSDADAARGFPNRIAAERFVEEHFAPSFGAVVVGERW